MRGEGVKGVGDRRFGNVYDKGVGLCEKEEKRKLTFQFSGKENLRKGAERISGVDPRGDHDLRGITSS